MSEPRKHTPHSTYLLSSGPFVILVDTSRKTFLPKVWDLETGEEQNLAPEELNEVIDAAEDLEPVSHSDVTLLQESNPAFKVVSKNLFSVIFDVTKTAWKDSKKAKEVAKKFMKQAGSKIKTLEEQVRKNADLASAVEDAIKDGTINSAKDLENLSLLLENDPEMAKYLDGISPEELGEKPEEALPPTPVLVTLRDAGKIFGLDMTKLANLPTDELLAELDRKKSKFAKLIKDMGASDPKEGKRGLGPTGRVTLYNLDNRTIDFTFKNFDNQYKFIEKFGLEKHPGANVYLYHT